MLKLNLLIGKSVRPLAFSLVTASSLIALVSPTLAMDPPLSRREILRQYQTAKQTLEAATKDVDLALVEFQTAGERIAQEQTVENFQLFGAAEKKKTENLEILEVAKEKYNKLEKLKAESDAATKLAAKKNPTPVGQKTELVESVEKQFNHIYVKFALAETALEKGQKEDSLRLFKEVSEDQQWLRHALLMMIEKEMKDEQNPAQKNFLEYTVNNLKIQAQKLSGQMDTLRLQLGAEVLPPPPVVKPAMPQPVNRVFTKPVDEAAKAAAEKAAEARAVAEAKLDEQAQAQLAAHQKWMDEQAEQRKQAAAAPAPAPVQDEQKNGEGNTLLQALRAKKAVLKTTPVVAAKPVSDTNFVPLPLVDLGDWDTDENASYEATNTDAGKKAVIRKVSMSDKERDNLRQEFVSKFTPASRSAERKSETSVPAVVHGEIKKVANIPIPPKSGQQMAEDNDDDTWDPNDPNNN